MPWHLFLNMTKDRPSLVILILIKHCLKAEEFTTESGVINARNRKIPSI